MVKRKVFKVFVFVSCVVILQNSSYVDYLELKRLMDDGCIQ